MNTIAPALIAALPPLVTVAVFLWLYLTWKRAVARPTSGNASGSPARVGEHVAVVQKFTPSARPKTPENGA